MDSYDYNKKKSIVVSTERLKKIEELMSLYGPLNELGYPNKVTSVNANYYSKELKIRRIAIENICSYIKNQSEEYDIDALRKAKTSVLQKLSSYIEKAKEKAAKTGMPIVLAEDEKNAIMAYAIKKDEEYYINPDTDEEEFLSEEELESAYGGESPASLSKRFSTNYLK